MSPPNDLAVYRKGAAQAAKAADAHVRFAVWCEARGLTQVVSIISKEAVVNLGLKEGMTAYAVIKASNVMIAVD